MNFRRKLKHYRKAISRGYVSFDILQGALMNTGLVVTSLTEFDKLLKLPYAKAKSKHFTRLRRAARNQNKFVYMLDIAIAAQEQYDLRTIKFYSLAEVIHKFQ